MSRLRPALQSFRAHVALAAVTLLHTGGAIAAGGQIQALHVFRGTPDGNYPGNRLLPLAGALYGATAYGGAACSELSTGCGAVFEALPSSHGNAQKIIYRFKGLPGDGAEPGSGILVADSHGAIYGTTIGGGNGPCNYFGLLGCGVVYKLTPTSTGYTESVIYNFQGGSDDGANPVYGVILDSAGNLYGTTSAGGSKKCPGGGCGVVYKLTLTPSGYVETVLHKFIGSDGTYPDSAPILDAAGNLYGTTFDGGTGNCPTYGGGCGAVYELSPNGRRYDERTLYNFQGGADGVQVQSGLWADSKGDLFGMTTFGGTGPCAYAGLPTGCGTIFELTRTGTAYTESVLYSFKGTDGSLPTGNLYPGPDGKLYGTTPFGGSGACSEGGVAGCGTVFAFSQTRTGYAETVLYNFKPNSRAGIYPNDPLTDGSRIYLTTCCGGPTQLGVLDSLPLNAGFR